MSSPGYLAVGGVEIANNARTVGYLARGLGGPWFQTVQSQACPDLLQEAFPLATCATQSVADQLYTNPLPSYRMWRTGVAPSAAEATWLEAGQFGFAAGLGTQQGVLLPSAGGAVNERVLIAIDLLALPAANRQIGIGHVVNAGTATAATIAAGIVWTTTGAINTNIDVRPPGGGSGSLGGVSNVVLGANLTRVWLDVTMTAQGVTLTLWDADPDLAPAASAITRLSYGYSPTTVFAGTTVPEVDYMAGATEVAIGTSGTLPKVTEAVISEVRVWANPCTQSALADLFPSDTLWPADDLYPGLYGEFHDPGTDSAPWIDVDRPEGLDYLGLLIDDIEGLDTTSDRAVDASADGIGGILGPETLAARPLTVKGWLIASDCSAMEYARRWLAETLADALCDGCDLSFVDVRTTCGDDPAGDFYTNRWRLYDCGLTGMQTDTTGGEMCCFVTPIQFTITAGDPYLYGPVVNVSGPVTLNPGASDTSTVSFETWLFGSGTPQCVPITDQGIGIDAGIFTFYGGSSGIEAGLVYPSLGLYPSDNIWPGDCVIPADGVTQETNDSCPFAFTFSIGPGESFVVDNSRQLLTWTLADGTVMDGSPQLNLASGDVLQWIDTCAGVGVTACAAAYAGCTCDDTATVQIQTQHRER